MGRGACSGRSRPNRNVSTTRSNSSSQLMRAKNTCNNFPFDLNLSALNPFPALPTSSQPESCEISSPLQPPLENNGVSPADLGKQQRELTKEVKKRQKEEIKRQEASDKKLQ